MIKTKEQNISTKLQIWAIPKSSYHIQFEKDEGDPAPFPFTYEVRTDRCWATGAVMVKEAPVEVYLPGDIDLYEKAIETLDQAEEDVMAEAHRQVEELKKQRQQLLLLSHSPAATEDDSIVSDQ